MDYSICAPPRLNENGKPIRDYTCYSETSLKYIAEQYNENHQDKIVMTNNFDKLYERLKEKLYNKCEDDEVCWATQPWVKDEFTREHTFLAVMPKNKYDWLSSLDIIKIITQHEIKYAIEEDKLDKKFTFLGALPIDFHEVFKEYAELDIADIINNGFFKIAAVLNLDKHNQSGSHWVAIFITMKPIIEFTYYDSTGRMYPDQVGDFFNYIFEALRTMKIVDKNTSIEQYIHVNRVVSQKKNSECGPYSCRYIIKRAKGESFINVCNDIIDDEMMNECRNMMFRPRNPTGKKTYNPSLITKNIDELHGQAPDIVSSF